MAEYPLNLVLRELDDIKVMIRGVGAQVSAHTKEDDQRFDQIGERHQEIQTTLASWRSAGLIVATIVSALVSIIIGLVVKHF